MPPFIREIRVIRSFFTISVEWHTAYPHLWPGTPPLIYRACANSILRCRHGGDLNGCEIRKQYAWELLHGSSSGIGI